MPRLTTQATNVTKKKAAKKADRLGRSMRMRHTDIQHFRSDEIEPPKTRVRAYVRALAEELRLRRKHAIQFIGTPDAGHHGRLERLETTIAHYHSILQGLRPHQSRRLSRTTSPVPRTVQRHRGANPEEERRASARAEARRQREEEHERQHLVVIEAEKRRPRGAWAEVQGAYNMDLETSPPFSQQQQHAQDAQRASEEGGRSQEATQIVDGSTSEEESHMDTIDKEESPTDSTTSDHLKECPPEDWSPREVTNAVDTSDDDTELDSASRALLDDNELDSGSSTPLSAPLDDD